MTRSKKFWMGFGALAVTLVLLLLVMFIWLGIFLWFLSLFGINGWDKNSYDSAAWYFHAPNFIVGYLLGVSAINFCPWLYRSWKKESLDTAD